MIKANGPPPNLFWVMSECLLTCDEDAIAENLQSELSRLASQWHTLTVTACCLRDGRDSHCRRDQEEMDLVQQLLTHVSYNSGAVVLLCTVP